MSANNSTSYQTDLADVIDKFFGEHPGVKEFTEFIRNQDDFKTESGWKKTEDALRILATKLSAEDSEKVLKFVDSLLEISKTRTPWSFWWLVDMCKHLRDFFYEDDGFCGFLNAFGTISGV